MTGGAGLRALSAIALALGMAGALAAVPSVLPETPGSARAPGTDAALLWRRLHVIGASASAGFGVRPPWNAQPSERMPALSLDLIAEVARLGQTDATGDASSLFFANPCRTGRSQVDALLARDPLPTVVFAGDFLFWFSYGALDADRKPIAREEQRLALLERGLAELDRVAAAGVPVVVGDIPDMSESVARMLAPSHVPKPATRDSANQRIRAWAAGQPLVALLPLAELIDDLRGGRPFDAGRRSWSEAGDGPLIQRDRLHPTFAGTVALLAKSEQAANERFLGVRRPNAPGAPAAFEDDPAQVAQRLREAAMDGRLPRRAAGAPRTPANVGSATPTP